ncbi:MAG: hypothetical protein ACI8P0_005537, partial [Planctomycetaceae bacterium]
ETSLSQLRNCKLWEVCHKTPIPSHTDWRIDI